MVSDCERERLLKRANALCEAATKARDASPIKGSPEWNRMKEIESEAIRALDAYVESTRPPPYRPADVPSDLESG
jgi:hypothetical protein